MEDSSMSQLLFSVLFLTMLLITSAIPAASALTLRADLTHVDSERGFTRWELASLRHRGGAGNYYGQHPTTAPVAPGTVRHADTEYLIHFGIGTPRPHQVALTLDTGSDLVWTQCTPCLR
ncbi:hypothetical protein PR202_gb17551 [Eleusine coracana subsp. coracana]|uniref:Peptidase A1 domain-containing protein n=1 Tax=Eleusine coracana subsp. coracana TaxID=191504 RepID=A0AAV5F3U8_ELECO|nr:hypothetical protein PR202_gb17551 [Eleusine coracana subsp. coracana]